MLSDALCNVEFRVRVFGWVSHAGHWQIYTVLYMCNFVLGDYARKKLC